MNVLIDRDGDECECDEHANRIPGVLWVDGVYGPGITVKLFPPEQVDLLLRYGTLTISGTYEWDGRGYRKVNDNG